MSTQTVPRPARPALWQRWGFWFALSVLGCLLWAGAQQAYRHYRVTHGLETALANQDRAEPGWRLMELEAARPVVADGDNAALRVDEADRLLNQPWMGLKLDSPAFALALDDSPAPARLAAIRRHLDENRAAVDAARGLADLPHGRFPIDYPRNVLSTPLPHADRVRRVAALLAYDTLERTEAGDLAGALRSCRALLNAGRSVGDEPIALSQFLRITCVQVACHAAERILARGEVTDDDLLALQRLLQAEERFPRLFVIVRGDRACVNELLDALEAGAVPLADLALLPDLLHHGPYTPVGSVDQVRTEHPRVLARLNEAVEVARLPAHRRRERVAAFETALNEDPEHTVLFALVPDLRWLDDLARRTDARLRCLIAAVAVERYRLRCGRWPNVYFELTPDLLPLPPLDPGTGHLLGYVRRPDGVVVFAEPAPDLSDNDGGGLRVAPDLKKDGAFVQLFGPHARQWLALPPHERP